jgi:bone morphogenetic protein 4
LCFVVAESKVDALFPEGQNRFRLHFEVNNIPEVEQLQAAELLLSRRVALSSVSTQTQRRRVRVLVHDVVRPGVRGSREPILRLLDSKEVDAAAHPDNSVSLDVLPAVVRWRAASNANHGLLIEVLAAPAARSKHNLRLRRSRREAPAERQWLREQPLLFAYTDDARHRRSKVGLFLFFYSFLLRLFYLNLKMQHFFTLF